MGKVIVVRIETAIRNVHWSTVQAGVKSVQTITIDPNKKTIKEEVSTGKTKIFGMEFPSVRDKFNIEGKVFEAARVKFTANGETATAVRVLFNINYSFNIILYPYKKLISIDGAHDGYPSYNISVNGKSVYDCVQGFVVELAGDSDVIVKKTNISW